jgi:hypothetical protein
MKAKRLPQEGIVLEVIVTCPPKTDPHVKLEKWIKGRQGDEQEEVYPGTDNREA